MARLTPAARVAFAQAAREAVRLGSESLECEHVLIGLCTADILSSLPGQDVPAFTPDDLREARRETDAFLATLREAGLDPERARHRLRQMCVEERREWKAFGGHRSLACRQAFARAAELADGEISTFCLATSEIGVDCLAWVLLAAPGPLVVRILAEQEADRPRLLRALTGHPPDRTSS